MHHVIHNCEDFILRFDLEGGLFDGYPMVVVSGLIASTYRSDRLSYD